MLRTVSSLLALFILLATSPIAHAQSQAEGDLIADKLNAAAKGRQSCSQARKELRKLRDEHPNYHFAFAGRKDRTITGMRGCGYAWNLDLETAQQRAMLECRKSEVEFGTGGDGTRICRLLR
ncbi:MAG: hypothetical protein AAF214_10250 [Pseudomonadota bacterium]